MSLHPSPACSYPHAGHLRVPCQSQQPARRISGYSTDVPTGEQRTTYVTHPDWSTLFTSTMRSAKQFPSDTTNCQKTSDQIAGCSPRMRYTPVYHTIVPSSPKETAKTAPATHLFHCDQCYPNDSQLPYNTTEETRAPQFSNFQKKIARPSPFLRAPPFLRTGRNTVFIPYVNAGKSTQIPILFSLHLYHLQLLWTPASYQRLWFQFHRLPHHRRAHTRSTGRHSLPSIPVLDIVS